MLGHPSLCLVGLCGSTLLVTFSLEEKVFFLTWGHYITYLGRIKQYKSMGILRDFAYYNALFGLVSYNDPCFNLPVGDLELTG